MISGTGERRKAILDGVLLPRFEATQAALEEAEGGREQALGALKSAKAESRAVLDDMRHVGRCRDIACSRCGALVPAEAES